MISSNRLRFIGGILLTALLLPLLGAADRARDAEVFRKISNELQTGGSYYKISGAGHVAESLNRLSSDALEIMMSMPEPPPNMREILEGVTRVGIYLRLAGLDEIQGCGASSLLLSPRGERKVFSNRAFLALRPDRAGLLWQLAGPENRSLQPFLAALPRETASAFEFDLALGELGRFFAGIEELNQVLSDPRLEMLAGDKPENILAGFSGPVRMASVKAAADSQEALNGYHFMFSLPDADRKFYELLIKFSFFLSGKVEENRIQFGPICGDLAPEAHPSVTWQDGRITFYLNPIAEQMFTAPERLLTDDPLFRQYAAGVPLEGIGFFYTNDSYGGVINALAENLELKVRVPERKWPNRNFTVIQRKSGGFLMAGTANLDHNQSKLINQAMLPVAIGAAMVNRIGIERVMEMLQANQPIVIAEQRPDTAPQCAAGLSVLWNALQEYSAMHDDAFPSGENIAGFQALLLEGRLNAADLICPGAIDFDVPVGDIAHMTVENSSYVYFAGSCTTSHPKLPLALDWPGNHEDAFNVLYVDGTIETVELEAENFKRMVSMLQTMHKYPEPEFRRILEQADRLDREFDLD